MRRAFTLIELVVVVTIVVILAAILLPVFQRASHSARDSSCQSNLKRIALGFKQYQQDHQSFPPISSARRGHWSGSLQPYVKSWQVFQCPVAINTRRKTSDYFYNSRLDSMGGSSIPFGAQTILGGDGADNSPTDYALSHLPRGWRDTERSPAFRHRKNQGANYAFVDGHVKWLKPEKISTQTPRGNQNVTATFAVR